MEDLKIAFGNDSDDFYKVLNVSRDSNQKVIKKSYLKCALKYHPDKNHGDKDAELKFKCLGLIHATLSDEKKRDLYDRTGMVSDIDGLSDEGETWYNYWRNLFPVVNVDDIVKFEHEYKHSEEEKQDVINAYMDHKGNMKTMLTVIMLSGDDDIPRYAKLLQEAICSGEIKEFPIFKKNLQKYLKSPRASSSSLQQSTAGKKKKINTGKRKVQDDDLSNLRDMILSKRGRNTGSGASFISSLEKKYGSTSTAGKKKKGRRQRDTSKNTSEYDLADEEFAKIQEKLLSNKK